MKSIEEDLLNRSLDFMERQVKAEKPFFLWHVSTRNHVWVWIHLNEKYKNSTGNGIFADGMAELDDVTGKLGEWYYSYSSGTASMTFSANPW